MTSFFPFVDDDAAVSNAYGKTRKYLEANGTPIGSPDTLIAAHAIGLSAVLVANTIKEFRRVPNLIVENRAE